MASRAADWIAQALADLDAAHANLETEHHEWACFIAQQAAEKAVKAVAQAHGGEARGHSVLLLLKAVLQEEPPPDVVAAARRLDRFYILTRYPNGWAEGKPRDFFDREQAEGAVTDARRVVEFCQGHMA
jgi:HEPN domain-containing protein